MMGADISNGRDLVITGPNVLTTPSTDMHCKASGTTLRFFTALSTLTDGKCVLTGDESLIKRPIGSLILALRELGVKATFLGRNGYPPVEVQGGGLEGGAASIPGDVSSQFVSALLFACSRARSDTALTISTHLESRNYVQLTVDTMRHFGIELDIEDDWKRIHIPGNQRYRPTPFYVEGDYSSAAFLMAAGALSGSVEITGLKSNSLQGDAAIIPILEEMGASLKTFDSRLCIQKSDLDSLDVDASQIPDLVPVLALLATQAAGTTRIWNAGRLRLKESDRLTTTATELGKMGAKIKTNSDGFEIRGPTNLIGQSLYSHGDHRIAMTCVLAGMISEGKTIVHGIEDIGKSYPSYVRDMRSLGAQIELGNGTTGEEN
jgi:3-phosphoshikimate 1-carboxyvinyltransferase